MRGFVIDETKDGVTLKLGSNRFLQVILVGQLISLIIKSPRFALLTSMESAWTLPGDWQMWLATPNGAVAHQQPLPERFSLIKLVGWNLEKATRFASRSASVR